MSYRIAGIDVHKKMLAVVVADVEVEGEGEYQFKRCRFSSSPEHLRLLADWLIEQQVEEAVMESTAQYWKPVWQALEQYWQPACQKREGAGPKSGALHLAQAVSNRGPRGRKNDFLDAERLVKRLVAQELKLSFVPDPEQRLWRTVTRKKVQLTRFRERLQNQLEALLEEAHIKLSSFVSDLLGASARRMLHALTEGETNAEVLAGLADKRLRAAPEQLQDALGACRELSPVYRELLKMALEEVRFLEEEIQQLDQALAGLLRKHEEAVKGLAEMPGLGVDSAQQILAEVGVEAEAFASAKKLASWVGVCPGEEESAGANYSHRSPQGNRQMRRLLNQCANAAVKVKGSIFEIVYRRLVPPGTQTSYLGDCPSALSVNLADSTQGRAIRGTGPGSERKVEEKTHGEDDPRTSTPGLPGGSSEFSAGQRGIGISAGIFDLGSGCPASGATGVRC